MGINDFMGILKREGRYGTPGETGDQPTLDILNSINVRRKRIWARFDWAWALEALSFALTVGSQGPYSVTSVSGALVDRITDLYPVDTSVTPNVSGKPIIQTTRQDFYGWVVAGQSGTPVFQGPPLRYINVGRSAAGLWQIMVGPAPATATTVKGWAKKILTTFTLADVVANTAFDYFPDGVIETVLKDGCQSDIERIQGNLTEAARLDQAFEAKLEKMLMEQAGVGKDDSPITTPPPDAYRWKKRMRASGGTGVY